MSDTLRMLNYYRLSLVHDEEAFAVVALLSKEGRMTEDAIANALDKSLPQTNLLLSRLFRSNLIALQDNAYALSDTGQHLAHGFGLTVTAVRSLLRATGVGEAERDFLTTCFHAQVKNHREVATNTLASLRSWAWVRQHQLLEHDDLQRLNSRVLFTVIMADDPSFHGADPEQYCNFVLRSVDEMDFDEDFTYLFHAKQSFVPYCTYARKHVETSKRFLVWGNLATEQEDHESALAVILVWVVAALKDTPVSLAVKLADHDTTVSTRILSELSAWRPSVLDRILEALGSHGIPDSPAGDVKRRIQQLLDQRLREAASQTDRLSASLTGNQFPDSAEPGLPERSSDEQIASGKAEPKKR